MEVRDIERSASTSDQRPESRRVALLTLKPDCVMQGLAELVLSRVMELGFEAKHFRIGRAPQELRWRMHGEDLLCSVDDWRHNSAAYDFGPIVGLLLWYNGNLQKSQSAQDVLNRKKGGAIPANFGEDTLRGQLGASNRVFNLLHCAESTSQAQGEGALWLGLPCLRVKEIHDLPTLRKSNIICELQQHDYHSSRGFDEEHVWKSIRRRCEHVLEVADFMLRSRTIDRTKEILDHMDTPGEKSMYSLSLFFGIVEQLRVYVGRLESYLLETRQRYPTPDRQFSSPKSANLQSA